MQIFINARFLSQPLTGVQRFATELLFALDNLIESGKIDKHKLSFTLVGPKSICHDPKLKNIPLIRCGRFSGHLWEQLELPFYTRNGLLINLCNTLPLFRFNQVVIVHDASVFGFPQTYSLIFSLWYKLLLFLSGLVAEKIITVSRFSKDELIKYCRINAHKLQVVYEGKEHITKLISDFSILQKYDLQDDNFVLAVSSNKLNKNFSSFVLALDYISDAKLDAVVAGGSNNKIYNRSPSLSSSNDINVKTLGYITDQDLKTLYEHAACFVYPSFYEGFGLPPLEAMACGCPVIVSNAASLPEVCGDAALYCNPYDPKDIALKIQQLMNDDALRTNMRQKGLERASQFTWEKCALETYRVIEKILL